jgi:uracil-DNA glycosylase family 4
MKCTERCPECPSRGMDIGAKNVVSGDWNEGRHNILFVGDNPGAEENNRQRIFCGRHGEEFNNTYLPAAGLTRDEVSMTNTVKCNWGSGADSPPPSLVKSCSEFHLRRELAHHNPDYVVLMGGTANSLLDLDIDMEHGMARKASLLGWQGTVFSTFHPSLGMHKADAMLAMIDTLDGDFPRLKRLLRGESIMPVDDCPEPEFEKLVSPRTVRNVMQHYPYWEPVAVDTESKKRWRGYHSTIRYTPWCATWCHEKGYAYMVRVDDEDAYREFCEQLYRFSTIIMHNSCHDHEILARTGCTLPWSKVVDTMQMAYDDGRLRQSLKILSYRLLGKRMTSFDEIVVPHGRELAIDYFQQAMLIEWPKPEPKATGDTVMCNCPECKGKGVLSLGKGKARKTHPCDCDNGKVTVPKMTRPQSLNDKLYRLATDIMRNPDVKLWKRWNGWAEADPDNVQVMMDRIGAVPLPSIDYVPEDRAIVYACGDALATWMVYPKLQERLVDIRRRIQCESHSP